MLNALAPVLPGFWGGSAGQLPTSLPFTVSFSNGFALSADTL